MGENLAAIGGGHSLAEAVNLLVLALLGLVGTFHFFLHSFRVIILNIRPCGQKQLTKQNLPAVN